VQWLAARPRPFELVAQLALHDEVSRPSLDDTELLIHRGEGEGGQSIGVVPRGPSSMQGVAAGPTV
jgi:hypothetical protein